MYNERGVLLKLKIIHTNDLHGHLEHWPLISAYIEENRTLADTKGEALLTIDVGDAMDSVHPLVEATYGKVIVDLFNQADYDVVTVGNNEGLNFSKERLKDLYKRANFTVTVANLLDKDTQDVPSYAQKVILKEIDGLNIAFIGLTAPYPTYSLNGYHIENPIDSLQQILASLDTDQIDLVILLSHLGIETDRYIANLFPEIQLIIGAHTHHILIEGEWENQTFLCAAGKYGNYVGSIDLYYDESQKNWQMSAEVLSIHQLSDRYHKPIHSTYYEELGITQLNERRVANIPKTFQALQLSGEDSFIQMALKAISEATGVSNALLNSGLFLSDLPQGVITEQHLHEALPHPMHLAIVEMTGENLIKMLNEMAGQTEDLRYKLINGLGFRGKIFGELVSNTFAYNDELNQWEVDKHEIENTKIYKFVTVDHLWFLPFFTTINDYGNPKLVFPDFIRHAVRNYLEKTYPLKGGELLE